MRLPELGPREVARLIGEANVRQEPVGPLARKEPPELGLGPLLVPARVADRDAGRVPAPLVRVEAGGRAGCVADPVLLEDGGGPLREVAVRTCKTFYGVWLECARRHAREL